MYEDVVGQRGGGGVRGSGGFRGGGGVRGGGFARPGGFRHRGHAGRFGRFGRASWWGGWGGWWPGWGYGYGYDGWCNPYLAPYDPDCWYGYGGYPWTGIAGDGIGEITDWDPVDWWHALHPVPVSVLQSWMDAATQSGFDLCRPEIFGSLYDSLRARAEKNPYERDLLESIDRVADAVSVCVPQWTALQGLRAWVLSARGVGSSGIGPLFGPGAPAPPPSYPYRRRLVRTRADTRTPEQIAASRASAALYQRLQEQIALQARDPRPFRAKLIASLQQRYGEAKRTGL